MLRMPLKFKWGKKSGSYDLNQDIYVLTIYIGEVSLIQCTLNTNSTAQQCIDYLCEKFDLNQAEIFGFRYQMKFSDPDCRIMRWVEMNKSLRKQLEKWASKPRQLQLAILYHTPNVFSLHDQMARSLYFNLLKLDVLSGKFNIDIEKYINLAAYGLHVENSDFDPNIHTIDYLRTLKLLPEHLCRNAQINEDCLYKILTVYKRLSGMQSSYAAFLYIVDVQQCEGYGEESFLAKDDESTEVKLGYSLEEIFVKRYNGTTIKYKWLDIKDIKTSKRNLIIKCNDEVNAIFTMEDIEMARYVCMVLNWQFSYSTTTAIQQKTVPMSIINLQGEFPKIGTQCGYLRHSNADIHSTRTTNSIDMGVISSVSLSALNAAKTRKSLALVNRSSSLIANRVTSSMLNVNTTNLNLNQNSQLNNTETNNNYQSTVHSVQSINHLPILPSSSMSVKSGTNNMKCQFYLPPSLSTPSLHTNNIKQQNELINYSENASPVYRPNCINRPPALSLSQTSSVISHNNNNNYTNINKNLNNNENWIKVERREILKKLLAQQKQIRAIGSSPEIHMLGTNYMVVPNNKIVNGDSNDETSRNQKLSKNFRLTKPIYQPHYRTVFSNRFSDEKAHDDTYTKQFHSNSNSFTAKWCSTPNLLFNTNGVNNKIENNVINRVTASSSGASSGCGKRCIAARNISANNTQQQQQNALNNIATSNNNNNILSQMELNMPLIQYSTSTMTQTSQQNSYYQLSPIYSGRLRSEFIKNKNSTECIDLTVNTTQHLNVFEHSKITSPQFQVPDNQLLIGMLNNNQSTQNFSQGHVISLAAGSNRSIGQPIIYPIPTSNPTQNQFSQNLFETSNCYKQYPSIYQQETNDLLPKYYKMYSTPHQTNSTSSIASFNNNPVINSEVNDNICSDVNRGAILTTLQTAVNNNNYKNGQLNSAGTSLISSVEEYDTYELDENRLTENNTNESNENDLALSISSSVSSTRANSFPASSASYYSVKKQQYNEQLITQQRFYQSHQQQIKMNENDRTQHVLLNGVVSYNLTNNKNRNEFFVSLNSINNLEHNKKDSNLINDRKLLNVLLEKLSIPQAVETEFVGIPAKRLSAGYSTSQSPENQSRNRAGNVFPYEDTRVMLQPHKHNKDGYINASNVQVPIGDNKVLQYIITQAPMRNTIDEFWRMIWESGTCLIVMLVNPHQTDKSDSCPTYWPLKVKEKLNVGEYFVKLVSSSTSKCQTTSVLSLKSIKRGGNRRTVYHLYCADFSKDGVPSSEETFLEFIDAVNSIKQHIENEKYKLNSQLLKHQMQSIQPTQQNQVSLTMNKKRSRSIGKMNFFDAKNRLRTQSVENNSNLWQKKFNLVSSSSKTNLLSNFNNTANSTLNPQTNITNNNDSNHKFGNSTFFSMSKTSPAKISNSLALTALPSLTVVHCTDGASESGVYVLVDVLTHCIENNVEIEIAQVLRSLRQQKMCLVKKPSQYRFVYELIVAFLNKSRLI